MIVPVVNSKYWAHPLRANFTAGSKFDFSSTLLFNSANRTQGGILTGSFRLNDNVNRFVLTADVMSN